MIKTWISVLSVSLLGSLMSLTIAQTQVIEFASMEENANAASQESAGVLVSDDGVLAAVVLKGFNPEDARIKASKDAAADAEVVKLKLISHDPISRLTLLQLPEGKRDGLTKYSNFANSEEMKPGAKLEVNGELCRLVSFVRRHNGRVLPLTFMRVNYSGKSVLPGSPVMNEKDELAGLIFQASGDGSSYYTLPVDVLKHLQSLKVTDGKFRPCWIGVSMDHLSDAPVVIGVRPDAPAKAAGIQKGDVMLSIDGKSVGSYPEVVNAFYYLQSTKPTEFKVIRGTEIMTFSVTPEVNPLYK